jgi:hypothetical protein
MLAPAARAQYPYYAIVQSNGGNNSGGQVCSLNKPVIAGDNVYLTFSWFNDANSYTVVSTLGNTTNQIASNYNVSNTSGTAIWGETATTGGAETFTITFSGGNSGTWQNVICFETLPYWSVSTSEATLSSTWTGAGGATLPSVTPLHYGDLIIAAQGGTSNTGVGFMDPTVAGQNSIGFLEFVDCMVTGFEINTTLSATAMKTLTNAGAGTMTTVALAPTGLLINSPSTLPDGALSTAYDYFLLASGGVASSTWSITSGTLQSGLSLNTSTGEISGTPTVSATRSITFRVTDGTSATSKTVSLTVGGTMNSIAIVQQNPSPPTLTLSSPVTAGHAVVIIAGNGDGFGAYTSQCTDGVGTVYHTISQAQYVGNSNTSSSNTQILVGILPSGAASLSVACGPTSGGGTLLELSGVNFVSSEMSVGNGGTAAATITSSTLTTIIPNAFLVSGGLCDQSGCSSTINSPFTSTLNTGNTSPAGGYRQVTSATGYTSSYATTSFTGTLPWQITLAGIRPSTGAVSNVAATQIGAFIAGP